MFAKPRTVYDVYNNRLSNNAALATSQYSAFYVYCIHKHIDMEQFIYLCL